jgi:hypothetical protein
MVVSSTAILRRRTIGGAMRPVAFWRGVEVDDS